MVGCCCIAPSHLCVLCDLSHASEQNSALHSVWGHLEIPALLSAAGGIVLVGAWAAT